MSLFKYLPLIILTGCAKATFVHLPSGDAGYAFQCEKAKMSSCYAQASQACGPAGYNILEDITTIHTESTGIPVVFSSFTNATTKEFRSMLIQCKQ
tara:strand:+ start:23 stop:310 length:288 start_codon:yes stop_codon:yes gene_type:complete